MDLLGQSMKKEKTPKQKMVLRLLIISVAALVIIVGLLIFLKVFKPKTNLPINLKINDEEVSISESFIYKDSNGEEYISIKELAKLLNYTYYNGGYLEFTENKDKGYIDNGSEIIGFENGNSIIYKTKGEAELIQNLEISRKIINNNSLLYVNVNDLATMLNLTIQNGNIKTIQKIADTLAEAITEKGYTGIDSDYNNLKAIAYNSVIVNKDEKKGIVNLNLDEIVGTKYDTIEFVELTKEFIVSANNKYGIMKQNGELKIRLIYDDLKILSYSPLLYVIKIDNKFGILDGNGNLVANAEFDKIGYNADSRQNIEETIIIPKLIDEIKETVVVEKDKKYGLVDIERRKLILDCTFDGIYGINKNATKSYVVKTNNQEYSLLDYLEYIKTRI